MGTDPSVALTNWDPPGRAWALGTWAPPCPARLEWVQGGHHRPRAYYHPWPGRETCKPTQSGRNPLPQGFLKQLASRTIILPSDGPSGRNNTLAVPRGGKRLIRESPPPPPPAPRLLKALVDSSASQHCPRSQRLSEKR